MEQLQMNNISGFKSNIKPEEVVDREEYINEIEGAFTDKDKSNVVILASESAVGKTSLVDKLLIDEAIDYDKVRIRTVPINNSEKIKEWGYFEHIFEEVCNKYKSTSDSFKSYIYSLKNKPANKYIMDYVLSKIYSDTSSKKKTSFIYLSILWMFKLGGFNIENVYNDNSMKGINIKTQYIKYIIKKHKILFAIDNIQNIDSQSLRVLLNIINETECNFPNFILEYTLINKDKSLCVKFAEYFQKTSANVKTVYLNKIEKEYIVDIVSLHMLHPNDDWEFNTRLMNQYESNADGNIRQMIDYGVCYKEASLQEMPDFKSYESSLNNITQLPDCAKQLLSFIICSDNCIYKNTLRTIAKKISLDVNYTKNILFERALIEESDDFIRISHASLADVWNSYPQYFSDFDKLSFLNLENFYWDQIKKCESVGKCNYDQYWIDLIKIYNKYKTERITNLFKFLDVDSKNLVSPQNAWVYIEKMLPIIYKNIDDYYKLILNIVRYCFESELYEEGYQIIGELEKIKDDDLIILYHAMYLSALDKHDKNIEFCNSILERSNISKYLYYNIKLISLSSYRSLNLIHECNSIHKELLRDKNFHKTAEYPFFLRLCEMYLDRDKSPKYLAKSVNLFTKEGNDIQAGKSLISYSYILASQGKLKKARQKIEKAEMYLSGKRIGSHMFLVNKAAISLYSGDFSENVWDMLNNSEITAVVPFDKLAIIVNKLVWCIENKNSNRYIMLIKKAKELLEHEPDKHIHGLIYYNIYYLLKSRNIDDCNIYLQKAKEMAPYCKPVNARLKGTPTRETKFALKYNWHVCFLAFWTYDL